MATLAGYVILGSVLGGQALAVGPRDAANLPVVIAVLEELTGRRPEVEGRMATVPAAEPELLPAVVRRLDEAGVVLNELALRGASLDDVFLSLTGHRAEPAQESDHRESHEEAAASEGNRS
jgi:oleandomycin transport system ATP-binding protein